MVRVTLLNAFSSSAMPGEVTVGYRELTSGEFAYALAHELIHHCQYATGRVPLVFDGERGCLMPDTACRAWAEGEANQLAEELLWTGVFDPFCAWAGFETKVAEFDDVALLAWYGERV